MLIVGLAPAANGGNRTGRVFTGDSSGDWLFAALHRVGLATQATQRARRRRPAAGRRADGGDGALRAAAEQADHRGARHLRARGSDRELALLAPDLRVVVALGAFGWDGALRALAGAGYAVPRPRPRFGHGAEVDARGRDRRLALLGCYHPSQQNTFTGRLTPAMLDEVLGRAASLRE